MQQKKEHPKEKSNLHPRNKHRGRYDLKLLSESYPALAPFVKPNLHGDESIDFANPEAVKALNTALLKLHYGIDHWELPENYLCPPIPGRADYIHHMAELLQKGNFGRIPTGPAIKCLDIGMGANCIYPIIGRAEYGWSFVGSDIDQIAIDSAKKIIESNPILEGKVECRLQENDKDIYFNIILEDEYYDLSIANPPFHASAEEAQAGTLRKLNNLNEEKITEASRNFGGQSHELWYEGGEEKFIVQMARQSKYFKNSCFWFSTLVSKKSNVKKLYEALKKTGAQEVETIPMGQGHKTSRIVAWTYLSQEAQEEWKKERWK